MLLSTVSILCGWEFYFFYATLYLPKRAVPGSKNSQKDPMEEENLAATLPELTLLMEKIEGLGKGPPPKVFAFS